MNTLKEKLNETMSLISAERDIVTLAKTRAETGEGRKRVLSKTGAAAAACAVVLVCGLTVSAVNFGWGHMLFGSTAAVVERELDSYKVEIGNVRIENAEGVPYNFTVGDVVSDGDSIYFNLLVEGMTIEPDWAGYWGTAGEAVPVNKNGGCRSTSWYELGMEGDTANTAVFANYTGEIKKGDVLEFELTENNMITDKNGKFVNMSFPKLADLRFEIMSDVNNSRKTIKVDHTAVFKNRPDPLSAEIAPYDEDNLPAAEIYVKSISVSPLNYVIKGTADFSKPMPNFFAFGWGNVWFILKNGERVCFQPDYMGGDTASGEYSILANFSPRYGVLDLNEVEAVEFDGVTVPFDSTDDNAGD